MIAENNKSQSVLNQPQQKNIKQVTANTPQFQQNNSQIIIGSGQCCRLGNKQISHEQSSVNDILIVQQEISNKIDDFTQNSNFDQIDFQKQRGYLNEIPNANQKQITNPQISKYNFPADADTIEKFITAMHSFKKIFPDLKMMQQNIIERKKSRKKYWSDQLQQMKARFDKYRQQINFMEKDDEKEQLDSSIEKLKSRFITANQLQIKSNDKISKEFAQKKELQAKLQNNMTELPKRIEEDEYNLTNNNELDNYVDKTNSKKKLTQYNQSKYPPSTLRDQKSRIQSTKNKNYIKPFQSNDTQIKPFENDLENQKQDIHVQQENKFSIPIVSTAVKYIKGWFCAQLNLQSHNLNSRLQLKAPLISQYTQDQEQFEQLLPRKISPQKPHSFKAAALQKKKRQ